MINSHMINRKNKDLIGLELEVHLQEEWQDFLQVDQWEAFQGASLGYK